MLEWGFQKLERKQAGEKFPTINRRVRRTGQVEGAGEFLETEGSKTPTRPAKMWRSVNNRERNIRKAKSGCGRVMQASGHSRAGFRSERKIENVAELTTKRRFKARYKEKPRNPMGMEPFVTPPTKECLILVRVTPKERSVPKFGESQGFPGIIKTGMDPTRGRRRFIVRSDPEARMTSTRVPKEEKKLTSKVTGWRSPFNRERKDSTKGLNEGSSDPSCIQ
jgi:hypothetical protein